MAAAVVSSRSRSRTASRSPSPFGIGALSGAHFNPAVTWRSRSSAGIPGRACRPIRRTARRRSSAGFALRSIFDFALAAIDKTQPGHAGARERLEPARRHRRRGAAHDFLWGPFTARGLAARARRGLRHRADRRDRHPDGGPLTGAAMNPARHWRPGPCRVASTIGTCIGSAPLGCAIAALSIRYVFAPPTDVARPVRP